MLRKFKTQNHEEWLALRHQYIGGSDAPTIIGCNPFSSPMKLWAEKTDRIPGFSGNLATEVGTYLEEFVAQKFEQITGKKVRNCNLSMVNDAYPWAIANVDRLIVGEDAGLEIKTTSDFNAKSFRISDGKELPYPEKYYVQCVHYMAVTGKARWYLAVLIGNHDFKWFTIERDEAEIEALMAAEQVFWNYVKADLELPSELIDGSKATSETICEVFPSSEDGKTVDLYPVEGIVEKYLSYVAQIKALESERDEYANVIKNYLADAEKAESARYVVTWKTASCSSFDSKKFAKDTGTDLSAWTKTTTYRTFKAVKAGGKK